MPEAVHNPSYTTPAGEMHDVAAPSTKTPKGAARRMGVVVVVGLVALGALLALAFGAKLESATVALVAAGGALVFCLNRLYRMVQAVSRPGVETTVDREVEVVAHGERALREERRRLLRAINELKFDFAMGKLSEEDYRVVREGYELRAVEVMRALESEPELDPELERALQQQSAEPQPAEPLQAEPAPESEVVEPDRGAQSAAKVPCPSCDQGNDPDARFCKYCGAEVKP